MNEIKELDKLIQDYIGPNKIIIAKNISSLLPPGENDLSDLLKIDVTVKNNETDGSNEDLHIVGKCVGKNMAPPTTMLFDNEIKFYKYVIPAFQKFQKNHGIPPSDFFPKFIAGRNNLTAEEKTDLDGVLLLENLSKAGYQMPDRLVGFDLNGAKLILRDLATLHSTALAIKLLEPETFKTEIKGHWIISSKDDKQESTPSNESNNEPSNFGSILLEFLKVNEEYAHVVLRFENFLKKMGDDIMKKLREICGKPPQEPFCTLIHGDMWINNTMQLNSNGTLTKNKFVDFQFGRVGSLASDLILFLTSSVQSQVLIDNFDDLIRYYYEIFNNTLKQYGCDGPQFSYDKFLEELKLNATLGILHSMLMLSTTVVAEKGKAEGHRSKFELEDVPHLTTERLGILLLEGVKRGWY